MTGLRRRPRGPAPAPCRITVRLSQAEHDAIRAAATAPGRRMSMARFVAEAALTAAGARPTPVQRRSPSRLALAEIAEAVAAVSRVGNNLNQLAREYNATGSRPVRTADEVTAARRALVRLQDAVERATPE